MIRLAIYGAAGKMGTRVVSLASKDDRFEIAAAVERPDSQKIGIDCGILAEIGEIGVPISDSASGFDVLIDFTTPIGTLSAIELALENGAALVTGTTGLEEEHISALKEASNKIGVFRASNFSRGIAVVAEVVGQLAKTFPDTDIEIVEAHHRLKTDSPSGTALTLGERIAEARGCELAEIAAFGRHGNLGQRPSGQIGIHAIRGGDIIGEHRIVFALPHETIIIEHRAIDRDLFASGALEAAVFVNGKIGYFEMKDLIELH